MKKDTLEKELRTLRARDRVVALVDHYVTTIDQKGPFDQAWARSLFTEDVRLEHEVAVLNGTEEVAAAHQMDLAQWKQTYHFSANNRVEVNGEHARLTARLLAIHEHPGENPPPPLIAANLMEADAVHTSAGWRFERFALRTIWRSGQSPAEIRTMEE